MKFKLGVFVLLTIFGSLFVSGLNVSAAPGSDLTVSFIDVGKGDAILIQDETGFNVLIDGGEPLAGPKVIDYMREQAVDKIDVMVATHAHKDHIGTFTCRFFHDCRFQIFFARRNDSVNVESGSRYFQPVPTTLRYDNFLRPPGASEL